MALFRGPKTFSSRSATSPWNSGFSYDVFLSFRGEDTRKNFTDHLYTALVNVGFRTFRDDPELEKGENIKQKLEEAISQSRSSVIVFSKDYTSSNWCLDELVMILERRRTSDHVVLPIFYDVDPSKLRKQADNLSKVPQYQENQSSEKLNGWQAALKEVAGLAGMVLKNEADGHESKFIQKLVTVIHDKIVPLSHVLEMLQKKLLLMYNVLDDAERKRLNNPKVKDWLDEHKETVYDAEDLLQEIQTEVLRQKMAPESESSTSKVKELISSSPYHAFDSASINSTVKKVLERLDCALNDGKDVLGLSSAGHSVSQGIPSTCLLEDEHSVFGRDEEVDTLIKLLKSNDADDAKISVIPIVGMGGIGKTTLAQRLYNDVEVKTRFDLHAWVYVSEEFDVPRILQHIYQSLTSDTSQNMTVNDLHLKLRKVVDGKKFLIVLDDIWNKKYIPWVSLLPPFESGAHGSKIIVTTRDIGVASMVGTVKPHSLRPISDQDGWLLFEKHAFKNKGVGAYSNLEDIGRQIVRKCQGLPLALKSLGGLLCSNLSVRQWERVLNSDIWAVENSDIMPALWVSYCYLPQCLKRCFAYCSIFPKGYEYEKPELISLWKAEGLLQRTKEEVVEEVGEGYFNDLVSQSFFQPYLRQGNKPYYIMHDLINDLAKFVSGDFCVSWEDSESSKVVTSKTRHFAYMKRYAESYEKFGALHKAEHLRTFLPLTRKSWGNYRMMDEVLYDLLPKLRYLRVLNLAEYNILELPESINNLKLLRHLNMSFTPIRKLPDTICSLYNLQELLLSDCKSLTALPTNLGRLTNLSHLDIKGTNLKEMPAHMGNLKDLQSLNEFVLGKHNAGDSILELKKLQNLRGRLCISGLGNIVNGRALEANILKDKKFLTELVLDGGSPLDWGSWRRTDVDTQIESEVLDKLQPHAKLKCLSIRQYRGTNFPDWLRYFASSTLVYLQLVQCVNCTSLPPLGQLESLRELHLQKLHGLEAIGPEVYGCRIKPFSSLQVLNISRMHKLKEWSYVGGADERGDFPKLRELNLFYCKRLTGELALDKFPLLEILDLENTKLSFAISRCPKLLALTSLKLSRCPEIESFPDQGLDAPNLTDIDILDCEKLRSLPEKMHTLLPSLRRLRIRLCPQLKSVPEGGLPSKLKSLVTACCGELIANPMQWGLQRLTSLERLSLHFSGCVVDSFPEEGLNLPRTLTHLSINDHLNLKTINQKGFGHLDSLQRLEIENCPSLKCLPGERLPTSLRSLFINSCPLLIERCKREKGEDWPKISHIAIIYVDDERI